MLTINNLENRKFIYKQWLFRDFEPYSIKPCPIKINRRKILLS